MLANVKGNAEVAIKKIKTETLKSDDFSPIHTLKLEPSTENLTGFLRKGKVWVWVSDDQFQIPVRLAGKVAFGTVSAVLVDVDGVKDWPYATKN